MDPALWAAFERDPETAFADIETLASVEERMMKGLKSATLRLPSPSLIVSHGRSIRVLASRLADRPFGPIPNAGVFRFRLEMDGPIEVEPLFGTSSG